MKACEVVTLVQHYRHDLLNQLQVIASYTQLRDLNKVETKIRELFYNLNEEMKLFSLNFSHVILWVLQFSSRYNNFHLTYDIDIENKSLEQQDSEIFNKLEDVMQFLEKRPVSDDIVDVELAFTDAIDYCLVEICLAKNKIALIEETMRADELEAIDFEVTEESLIFQFKVCYS